jgi:hypothetical protein
MSQGGSATLVKDLAQHTETAATISISSVDEEDEPPDPREGQQHSVEVHYAGYEHFSPSFSALSVSISSSPDGSPPSPIASPSTSQEHASPFYYVKKLKDHHTVDPGPSFPPRTKSSVQQQKPSYLFNDAPIEVDYTLSETSHLIPSASSLSSLPRLSAIAPGSHASSSKFYRTYGTRWWVILIYSLLTMQQTIIWMTYSPIAQQTKEFYNTNDDMVNLITALGSLLYIPVAMPTSWMMDKWGIRNSMLFFGILNLIASGIRIFATGPSTLWVLILAQSLNSVCGPIGYAAVPLLSSLWFPPKERTTATAVTTLASWVGSVIGYSTGFYINHPWQLPYLVYAQTGFSFVIAVCIIIYFPDRPPTPPSTSAGVKETIGSTFSFPTAEDVRAQ